MAPSTSGLTRAVTLAAPSPKSTDDSADQSPASTSRTTRFGAWSPNCAEPPSTFAVVRPCCHANVSASSTWNGSRSLTWSTPA
ncbi:Uncharacterised protein [Mycobacteroides abscessus]|nr:Uncharacterised protein [Mycobacteroides abscessus]